MPTVATIETTSGVTMTLDKFLTEAGRVPDADQTVEEELLANGVDGRRFRTVSNRYVPFTVATLETCATYAAAVTRCRAYDDMVGTNVKLSVVIGGTTYLYQSVHVSSAIPRAIPGPVAGSAAGSSHAAHIVAELQLVLMNVEEGSNP